MQLASIVFPGSTSSIWVVQRTVAIRTVKDRAPRFRRHPINQVQTEKKQTELILECPFAAKSFMHIFGNLISKSFTVTEGSQ